MNKGNKTHLLFGTNADSQWWENGRLIAQHIQVAVVLKVKQKQIKTQNNENNYIEGNLIVFLTKSGIAKKQQIE